MMKRNSYQKNHLFEHCESRPDLEGTSVDEFSCLDASAVNFSITRNTNNNNMDLNQQEQKQKQRPSATITTTTTTATSGNNNHNRSSSISSYYDDDHDHAVKDDFNHAAEGLLSGFANELDEQVGTFLRQGSMVAFLLWIVLMIGVFTLAPSESLTIGRRRKKCQYHGPMFTNLHELITHFTYCDTG
jgi:hypothetical protein